VNAPACETYPDAPALAEKITIAHHHDTEPTTVNVAVSVAPEDILYSTARFPLAVSTLVYPVTRLRNLSIDAWRLQAEFPISISCHKRCTGCGTGSGSGSSTSTRAEECGAFS
jgi:hypothetical protein